MSIFHTFRFIPLHALSFDAIVFVQYIQNFLFLVVVTSLQIKILNKEFSNNLKMLFLFNSCVRVRLITTIELVFILSINVAVHIPHLAHLDNKDISITFVEYKLDSIVIWSW